MSLTRFDPMREVLSLRDAMDRLFQDSFIRPSNWTGVALGAIAVPCDLWETKEAYHLRAEVPGLSPDDIQIDVTAQGLTISGEIKSENGDVGEGWLRQERRAGKFQRSFSLPMEIDANKVEANYNNGVLELILPKTEAVRPKSIKVRAAQQAISAGKK